ncbi:MAG: DUF2092 domain-containing protein, partial [Polymorphobacter sp.]
VSAHFDSNIEVMTSALEKLQFDASGQLQLSRPAGFVVSRAGGYDSVRMYFDGKTVTLIDVDDNIYAQVTAATSNDELLAVMVNQLALPVPGADFLFTNSYDRLSAGIVEAKDVGPAIVDGIKCRHLAFRNVDTDWQLWIRAGDKPLPCKFIVTSKTMAGAPQFSLRIHDWSFAAPPAGTFTAKLPAGARAAALGELSGAGDIPAPTPAGDKK